MKKVILSAVMLGVILVASLMLNIAVHELAHYTVADKYGLEPEMHISPNGLGAAFVINSESVAYTSYLGSSNDIQDFWIALAGPISNLFIGLLAVVSYYKLPIKYKTPDVALVFLAFALPAWLAFSGNLIPFGGSDGAVIAGAIG